MLAVAAASVAELARRERHAGAVVVSDLLEHPTAETVRTLNHPGNELLEPVAARLRHALGLAERGPAVTRPLLRSVVAPIEEVVVRAHRLPTAPVLDWSVDGRAVSAEEVAAAQLAWYADRPDALDLALERSTALRATLGLVAPDDDRLRVPR